MPNPDRPCWFFCFLLEAVQHIDGISKLGNADHSESPGSIPSPNLFHTLAHGTHGFPVVRFLTVLNLIELMAYFAPGRKRKSAKVIKGVAPELDGLGIGHARINGMCEYSYEYCSDFGYYWYFLFIFSVVPSFSISFSMALSLFTVDSATLRLQARYNEVF